MALPRRAFALFLACLVVSACGRDRGGPAPATSTTTLPATTTTRGPSVSGQAIPGVETAGFHAMLGRLGFTAGQPSSRPGFVTTTSTRTGATISTYGRGAGDVVKIVAEVDRGTAAQILVPVARTVTGGGDDRKVEDWLRDQLRKGPISATQPRTARETYGGQPFDLLVTASTATLSVGDLTS